MTTPMQQMLVKCKEVFARATELYGTDMSKVQVRFDLKGRVAGMAGARGHPREYYLRFNTDMIARETDEMVNVVAAHEIAHTVCQMKPELGRNHDMGWARVCRALGGTGDRTHDMDVVYGKGTTYEYTTSIGKTVRMNDRRHAMVQAGRTLTYKRGMGAVTNQCAYSIVGVRGQTLATPVIKQGAPTKEVPVDTIIPQRLPTFFIGAPETPRTAVRIAPTIPATGGSKADVARRIMVDGHRSGHSYETIIAAIMLANGHDKRLAASYYKGNAAKVGVPIHN